MLASSITAEDGQAQDRIAPDDERALWLRFKREGDMAARDALIRHYLAFTRILAARAYARRYGDTISFGEFMQLASVGLIEAVDHFSPDDGRASFRTYAAHWIRGAILGGLRSLSEVHAQIDARKRAQRDRLRSLAEPAADAADPAGASDPFDRFAEVAVGVALGFMLDDVRIYQQGEGVVADHCGPDLEMRRIRGLLERAARGLPDKERFLIEKHYFEGLAFEEIATLLSLSKGRVSQLHKQALLALRAALRQAGYGDWSV